MQKKKKFKLQMRGKKTTNAKVEEDEGLQEFKKKKNL